MTDSNKNNYPYPLLAIESSGRAVRPKHNLLNILANVLPELFSNLVILSQTKKETKISATCIHLGGWRIRACAFID